MTLVMDELDELVAAQAFEGYVVRKDLARSFKGRYPVPEYVAEFLLGRYCASTDHTEIQEGLNIVELQMRNRTVRAGRRGTLQVTFTRTRLRQADRHHHWLGWTPVLTPISGYASELAPQ